MPDMLVPLYRLSGTSELMAKLEKKGISIRPGLAPEKHLITAFAGDNFSEAWGSEVAVCFGKTPVSCILAIKDKKVIGFACYDAIKLGFFGPTGVLPEYRGGGVGKALLLITLETQKHLGYAYSIIGGAGPVEFYQKAVNAIPVPESEPGIYADMLK